MKIKRLILLLAAILLAIAVWQVQRSGSAGPQAVSAQDDDKTRLPGLPEKYRATLDKARAFLAEQQQKDGHWEGDDGKHPVATTALAGLALLMVERDDAEAWRHQPHVQKAADWLIEQARPERGGLIYSGHASETARYMEGHGSAVIFLAGLYQYEPNGPRRKKLSEVLTRAARYIAKAQSSQGGWYHTSRAEGHDFGAVLPTAIQLQALQAAENAGIAISREAMNDAHKYLGSAIEKESDPTPEAAADLAAAVASHITWRPRLDHGLWLARCRAQLPMGKEARFGRDDLGHFYYAQAAHFLDQQGDANSDLLDRYRAGMLEHLKSTQNKDGSWPGGDAKTGSVQTTALWCVVLQLGRGRHPAQRVVEEIRK